MPTETKCVFQSLLKLFYWRYIYNTKRRSFHNLGAAIFKDRSHSVVKDWHVGMLRLISWCKKIIAHTWDESESSSSTDGRVDFNTSIN